MSRIKSLRNRMVFLGMNFYYFKIEIISLIFIVDLSVTLVGNFYFLLISVLYNYTYLFTGWNSSPLQSHRTRRCCLFFPCSISGSLIHCKCDLFRSYLDCIHSYNIYQLSCFSFYWSVLFMLPFKKKRHFSSFLIFHNSLDHLITISAWLWFVFFIFNQVVKVKYLQGNNFLQHWDQVKL